jgi:hypothetical protein
MQGDSGLVISERHLRVSSPGWPFGGFVLARRSGRKATGMDSVVFLPQFRKGRSGLRQTALTGFQLNSAGKRRSIQ